VATGGSTAAELAAAGPDALLPDLSDTGRVLAAIFGRAAARPWTEPGTEPETEPEPETETEGR
jgi:hypothetical protein